MSCLTTSATRRSRSVPEAVLIASAAASSHDVLLVPMISVTRYTLITPSLFTCGRYGAAAASLSQHRVRLGGQRPLPGLEVIAGVVQVGRANAPPGLPGGVEVAQVGVQRSPPDATADREPG